MSQGHTQGGDDWLFDEDSRPDFLEANPALWLEGLESVTSQEAEFNPMPEPMDASTQQNLPDTNDALSTRQESFTDVIDEPQDDPAGQLLAGGFTIFYSWLLHSPMASMGCVR